MTEPTYISGLLFSAKQYALFFVPSLWPVLRRIGAKVVLGAAGLGALVLAVFVALGPRDFYRSAVEFQFRQPFRDDAISLLPLVRGVVGDIPDWWLGVLPFVGLVVSGLVALRARPGPASFALCVGLGLLGSVIFSKVGFVNYFAFAGAALLLAGVVWPEHDPAPEDRPSRVAARAGAPSQSRHGGEQGVRPVAQHG